MKMDIVESDLKQLFMWIKNLDKLCKSQQVLIEVLDERVSNIEHAHHQTHQTTDCTSTIFCPAKRLNI